MFLTWEGAECISRLCRRSRERGAFENTAEMGVGGPGWNRVLVPEEMGGRADEIELTGAGTGLKQDQRTLHLLRLERREVRS